MEPTAPNNLLATIRSFRMFCWWFLAGLRKRLLLCHLSFLHIWSPARIGGRFFWWLFGLGLLIGFFLSFFLQMATFLGRRLHWWHLAALWMVSLWLLGRFHASHLRRLLVLSGITRGLSAELPGWLCALLLRLSVMSLALGGFAEGLLLSLLYGLLLGFLEGFLLLLVLKKVFCWSSWKDCCWASQDFLDLAGPKDFFCWISWKDSCRASGRFLALAGLYRAPFAELVSF